MSDEIAIKVENVSKTFRLPHEKQTSLKSTLINLSKRGYEKQQALDNVSFEVKKGEFFGIVGRNGSGKSTLLKMLAGIYRPSKGSITVNGKLTPFIELGVGFSPELTGRENVYLNGALLGFSRKEMEAMYKDIVEFAELERFMDQKLKNYSSGMQVRLAFSIAIRVKSDILVLDEVLAVGDEAFQQKCINIFEKYKSGKQTIVLVTHDMSTVEKYCDRALLINNGHLVEIGDPRKIAADYTILNTNKQETEQSFDDETFLKKHGASYEIVKSGTKQATRSFGCGESVDVNIKWESSSIKNIGVALIKNSGEYVYATNTMVDKFKVAKGKKVTYRLKLDLSQGSYRFMIGFFGDNKYDRVHLLEKNLGFSITNKNQGWSGLVKLNSEWRN